MKRRVTAFVVLTLAAGLVASLAWLTRGDRIDPKVVALVDQLSDPRQPLRRQCAKELRARSAALPPQLFALWETPEALRLDDRVLVLRAFAYAPPDDEQVLAFLRELTESDDWREREAATWALNHLEAGGGPEDPVWDASPVALEERAPAEAPAPTPAPAAAAPDVAGLVEQLLAGEGAARTAAGRKLARIGPSGLDAAKAAADALARCAGQEDRAWHADRLVDALASMKADAVPALTDLLEASRPAVVLGGLEALRRIGPEARPAGPRAAALVTSSRSPDVRSKALFYLRDAAPDLALPALAAAVGDDEWAPRLAAALVGRDLGPLAGPILARALVTEAQPQVKGGILQALDALELVQPFLGTSAAREVVAPLAAVVSDERQPENLRAAAADLLGQLGALAGEAVPALEAAAQDQRGQGRLRDAAHAALRRISRAGG